MVDIAQVDAPASDPAFDRGTTPVRAWWMLAVLLTLTTLAFLDRYIVAMLVQPIKQDLKLTDFEIGLLLGPAFALSYGLAALPCGWAVDHFARRRILLISCFCWSVATMAGGLARSFGALFAARVGVGVGEASLGPVSYSLLADAFPRRRLGLATAIFQTGAKLGGAIAFGIGGLFVAWASYIIGVTPGLAGVAPWHLVLFMVGAPGLIVAFLTLSFAEPQRKGVQTEGLTNRAAIVQFARENRALLSLMFAGFGLVGLCNSALIQWVPTFMERRFGWMPIEYGPTLAAINLVAAAVAIGQGAVVDHLYARGMKDIWLRFYSWLLAIALPIAWAAFVMPSPWACMIFVGALNAIALPFFMYISSTIALVAPSRLRGQLNASFLTFIGVVSAGLGPLLVGFITTYILNDDNAIGTSLMITVGGSLTMAFLIIRLALKPARIAILRSGTAQG